MERTGMRGLDADLERQLAAVEGRSRPYARALRLLPAVLEGRAGRVLSAAWDGRRFHAPYERPLLLLAALRADARAEGPGHPLWEGFGAPTPRAEAVTSAALADALDGTRDRVIDALAVRSVQTNDTTRVVAWLWPAALAGASGGARPLALADVGASAGLNLVADDLPPAWTFDDGAPVEVARDVRAVARLGLDPAPLDATREEDVEWLRACVWPGDTARLERLEAALAAFRVARPRPDAPVLTPVSADHVPERLALLAAHEPEALVLAYQTVVRDYLPPEARREYEAGMERWVATQRPGQALWIELEGDAAAREEEPERAAALTAHVRGPDGAPRTLLLARTSYHPARLFPERAAIAELRRLLRDREHGVGLRS